MLPDVLTAAALLGLVQAHGAAPPLDRIMAAAALTEAPARDARGAVVGATRLAWGDGGRSLGPWQIHDIHGLTAAQRTDWHFAAAWMLHEEFQPAYDRLLARGGGALPAEERATYVYMAAERPAGWRGWSEPGLHSAAAEAFRANWQAVQDLAPEEIAVSAMERWIARLYAYTGTPYVFGGKDVARDGGLDCSGLLTRAARDCGLDLGDPDYTSADALKAVGPPLDGGLPIEEAAAQRGDLVLFHSTYGSGGPTYATHVGVWVRPGVMFDTHDGAHETRFNDGGYWTQHYLGLWRNTAIPRDDEEDPAMIAELQAQLAALQARYDDLDRYTSALTQTVLPGALGTLEGAADALQAAAGQRRGAAWDTVRAQVGVVRGQVAGIRQAVG